MSHNEENSATLSWWLYALDKTNAIVTTLTGTFIVYTRSPGAAYFAAGAVLCSITVKILKRCLRQPRPAVTVNGRRKKTYGMPSTHSAVITYFATYITLACLYLPTHPTLPPGANTLAPFIAVPLATTIALSRIWLGHHTWPQVGVGCGYGLLFAPIWFRLWTNKFHQYGPLVEGTISAYIPI